MKGKKKKKHDSWQEEMEQVSKAFSTITVIYRARINELFSIVNEIEEKIKKLEMKQNEGSRKE